MMTYKSEKTPELQWVVSAKDHGIDVTEYFDDEGGVLDFCGRLFYANAIFTMTLLQISHASSEKEWDGWTPPELCGKTYVWVMKCSRRGKIQTPRFFDHTHDLFGMLIAEMKQGADHIEISKNH